MKLSNLKFWSASSDKAVTAGSGPSQQPLRSEDNVVHLPVSHFQEQEPSAESSLGDLDHFGASKSHKSALPCGPMASPPLERFFEANHFGLGRHDGAHYKTQEALARGKALLVSKFQNTVASVIDQKQAKVDSLRNVEIQTQGVCSTATAQLNLACTRLERDISALRSQIELAAQGQGWVLSALNEYQIGFGKGVREAVDAEMLGL